MATIMLILLGLTFSVCQNHTLHWSAAILTILAAGMLLHAVVNVLNG